MNPVQTSNHATLVVGHANPDTDAVCSALAYATLHAWITGEHTVACHLDELAPETAWVLDHFGLAAPQQISDVYLHVGEVMERAVPHLRAEQTVREAGLLMQERRVGALPVVDDNDVLIGLIARETLADRYLAQLQLPQEIELPVALLCRTLDATLLTGDEAAVLHDRAWIATMTAETARRTIGAGDIVIAGDQPDVQRAVLEAGAGGLILTDQAQPAADVLQAARDRNLIVLTTPHSPFAAALLLLQSAPVSRVMATTPDRCRDDDLLADAQATLRRNSLPSLPVVNVRNQLQGVLLRRHLVAQARRRVILTDHNHPDQTAPGVTHSEIVAIVDHHNLGGLQTLNPLTIICEPVGCTCTLIAELYQRWGAPLDPALAGGMLAAILSDTVHFRSPTTTDRDRAAVAWLETICGEQAEPLARAMFRARLPQPVPPPAWWVESNWKTYSFGGQTIGIGQIELTEVESVMPPVDELRAELVWAVGREQLTTAVLLLTDILEQRSILLAADALGEDLAIRAFGGTFVAHQLMLPGVMSRKKQVVPPLAAALADA